MRQAVGEKVARSRTGEVLTRQRVSSGSFINEFDVHERDRDPEWATQWVRTSCHGKPDPGNVNAYHDNGWRPVSPKNYPNTMPDQRGGNSIERDGQMLMERPMQLHEEGLAENRADALKLRNVQAEAFGDFKKPKGFSDGRVSGDGRYDNRKVVNRTLEGSPTALMPKHSYATPGDDD